MKLSIEYKPKCLVFSNPKNFSSDVIRVHNTDGIRMVDYEPIVDYIPQPSKTARKILNILKTKTSQRKLPKVPVTFRELKAALTLGDKDDLNDIPLTKKKLRLQYALDQVSEDNWLLDIYTNVKYLSPKASLRSKHLRKNQLWK